MIIFLAITNMGKEKPGFLTPKAISNRIKSKGFAKASMVLPNVPKAMSGRQRI